MSFHFSPKIVRDGLSLYLDAANIKSYSGSGTLWNDLTNNKNNGTLVNGPTFTSDKLGAISFDGTNDYVTIDNSPSFNLSQIITLCCWVKFNGTYTGYSAPIFFKRNNSFSYFEQFFLGMTTSGLVNLALGNGSTNQYILTSSSYTNQLINIVGIINTNSNYIKLYINGSLNVSSSIFINPMDTSTNSLIIGSYNEVSFPGYFGGNIYNASIYNRVLSDSEILQNYNALKGRFI